MSDEKEREARLFQCLAWLGYKESEIKQAIKFFNAHHELKIYEYANDFAAGMLVRLIERQAIWKEYE